MTRLKVHSIFSTVPATNIAYIWFSLSGTPKHLHTKEDYLTMDMLQRRLQYRYITRWLATNGKVEEGVLSEGSLSLLLAMARWRCVLRLSYLSLEIRV
jgi:hypothetical protein